MNGVSPREIRRLYNAACAMDVIAFKPGNVSYASPGHGMDAVTFLRSAEASADAMASTELKLGERILDAVMATHGAVACNSNLGIILLCAPVAHAVCDYPQLALRDGVVRVLNGTSVADSLAVYEAIRLASPGGLGSVDRNDVAEGTCLALIDAMRSAADRDLIAAQYANGYADVFDTAMPYLEGALCRHGSAAEAVTSLYLFLLSLFPDTHIRRKYGDDAAFRVMQSARDVRTAWEDLPEPGQGQRHLIAFDRQLKSVGINPGTTADLCVATLFSLRLLQQAALKPRGHPEQPAEPTADGGRVLRTCRLAN